jgi:nucleotide-binding universal stress UspA family protein
MAQLHVLDAKSSSVAAATSSKDAGAQHKNVFSEVMKSSRRMLVCIDGSKGSIEALAHAAALARPEDELVLLAVYLKSDKEASIFTPELRSVKDLNNWDAELEAKMREAVVRAAKYLESGPATESSTASKLTTAKHIELVVGAKDVREAIVDYAASHGALSTLCPNPTPQQQSAGTTTDAPSINACCRHQLHRSGIARTLVDQTHDAGLGQQLRRAPRALPRHRRSTSRKEGQWCPTRRQVEPVE